MNRYLIKYLILGSIAVLWSSCNNSEKDLLKPQVYFEKENYTIDAVGEAKAISLQSRLSAFSATNVDVSYAIGDVSDVNKFNKKYGTEYELFDEKNVNFADRKTVISQGAIYSDIKSIELCRLNEVAEGKNYLLPIHIQSASLPILSESSVLYYVIKRPVLLTKAAVIDNNYIEVPLPVNENFGSVTYEALVYMDWIADNNTVMGSEGDLILRIGEPDLSGYEDKLIQIAGRAEYNPMYEFETGKWYHVAFTYEQTTGYTAIFINGKKAAEANWGYQEIPIYDGGFYIGKVKGFMWGERPFHGKMCEVRLWNVSRTEDQIRENMLNVGPDTPGLLAYYKLNGTDLVEKDGQSFIIDASKHNMDGPTDVYRFVDLDAPIEIE